MKRMRTLVFALGLLVVFPLFGAEIRQAGDDAYAYACAPDDHVAALEAAALEVAVLEAELDAALTRTPKGRPNDMTTMDDGCRFGCFMKQIFNDEMQDNPAYGYWPSEFKYQMCVVKCSME